jgi:8-oxo-dGTP pyrophosphatase MutT (NUDIX family)
MEYVIVYARPKQLGKVLLVLKNRPAWQAGRFNLPGGKIEPHETPEECAIRELKEETGYCKFYDFVAIRGRISGPWGTVFCVEIPVNEDDPIVPAEGETEILEWHDWRFIKDSKLLIPNLRVIIPLMMTGCKGWSVVDVGPSWAESHHTITITVPCDGDVDDTEGKD